MPAPMAIGAVMWRCPVCPVIVLDLSQVGAHVWSHSDPAQVAARQKLLVEARERLAAYDERKQDERSD